MLGFKYIAQKNLNQISLQNPLLIDSILTQNTYFNGLLAGKNEEIPKRRD